jgi:hypothetical protein
VDLLALAWLSVTLQWLLLTLMLSSQRLTGPSSLRLADLTTGVLWVLYSSLWLALTWHTWFSRRASSCMPCVSPTLRWSRASSAMSRALSSSDFTSVLVLPSPWLLTLMRIGLNVRTLDALHLDFESTSVTTWYPSPIITKPRCHGLVSRSSTKLFLMQSEWCWVRRLLGELHVSLASAIVVYLTIWALSIWQQILSTIGAQSILRSTFTSPREGGFGRGSGTSCPVLSSVCEHHDEGSSGSALHWF